MNEPSTQANASDGSAKLVYILYLASLLVGITSIIGVVIAYVNKAESPEWLQSHYQFQIRTFWISLLIGFIGVVTSWIGIGVLILLFLLIWMIVRCVKGYKVLEKGEAHPNPTGWGF